MKKAFKHICRNKVRTLTELKLSIRHIVTTIALLCFGILLILFYLVQTVSNQKDKEGARVRMANTNKVAQVLLSEDLSVLVNNQNFIDYIRSGKTSKKMENSELIQVFSHIKSNIIKSISLLSREKIIFSYGDNKSFLDDYVILSACSLDNELMTKSGECPYFLKLYFDKEAYFKKLISMDENVRPCNTSACYSYHIFVQNQLGSFPIINHSNDIIYYQYQWRHSSIFYLLMISMMALITMIFTLSILFINRLIIKYLQKPIDVIRGSIIDNVVVDQKELLLEEFINLAHLIRENNDKQIEIQLGKISMQLAHDIRSPLSAMEVIISRFGSGLSHDEKMILMSVSKRISDISNTLLQTYKHRNEEINPIFSESKQWIFIYFAIYQILLEKKMEFASENIVFHFSPLSQETGFAGIYGDIVEFNRVISNLLNNAVNAVLIKKHRVINVRLDEIQNHYCISIQDNGKGMSKNLINNTLTGNNRGLGVKHAINFVHTLSGDFDITSEEGRWTRVCMSFAKHKIPDWICSTMCMPEKILMFKNSQLGDESLRQMFNQREAKYEIEYFLTSEALLTSGLMDEMPVDILVIASDEMCEGKYNNALAFLKDEKLQIAHKVLLMDDFKVTDAVVQDLEKFSIQILPKKLIPYVEICGKPTTPAHLQDVEVIFIDDQKINTDSWELAARFKNIKIKTYNVYQDFLKEMNLYNKGVRIYIDYDLGCMKHNGASLAKHLLSVGFIHVYLSTSYMKDESKYPWVKGIISKHPPF